MKQMKSTQRGGMLVVLFLVGVLAYVGLLAAQVFPTFMEYQDRKSTRLNSSH